MKNFSSPTLGIVLALFAGVSWAALAIWVKLIEGISPLGIATGRMLIATLFMAVGIAFFGRWKEIVESVKSLPFWLLLGLFMSIHWYVGISALHYTLAADASLLSNITPLYLLIFSPIFLKERLSGRDFFYVSFTIFGVALLMFSKGFEFHSDKLFGDLLALLSAFMFAIYNIVVRKHRLEFPFYVMVFWMFSLSGLFMIVESWIFQIPLIESSVSPESWFYLFLIAFFSTALGHSAYNLSLHLIRSDQASTIVLTSPILAALLGYWFLGEELNEVGIMGMVITLIGIYWIIKAHFKVKQSPWDWLREWIHPPRNGGGLMGGKM